MIRTCVLKCLTDSHPDIRLPHQTEVFIGRSKATQIKDPTCSRQQVSLKADCEKCFVEVKQLGVNPSGINGFSTLQNNVYKLKNDDKLEILLNQYPHIIQFHPAPESNKRKLNNTGDSVEENRTKNIKMEIEENIENLWEKIDDGELYVFTTKGSKSSNKIAAYDMDGTLITTKSGKVYPVDCNDWKILMSQVPGQLSKYWEQGYKIVILTNQAPIGKGRVKIEDFKNKMESIVKYLGVPTQAFIATGTGVYRKPCIGMWRYLVDKKNDSVEIDMVESFYCGDAAGRLANWAPGKKKDHSSADRLLAENLGLKFFTPEEHFLGHKLSQNLFAKPEFNPKELKTVTFNHKLISNDCEILVLVGYPGSGKSHLANELINRSDGKYTIVCRDELGSWQRCASEATKHIKSGKCVIVDSTNPDKELRSRWISLSKELNVKCRCCLMNTTFTHAKHNNKFRELTNKKHLKVTDVVFYGYKNKFREPSTSEGFTEIIKVDMSLHFNDKNHEELYYMYLLEK